MTIINLDDRRRRHHEADGPGYAVCSCGEAWFELRDGAVCMSPDGAVTGYSGIPHCISCGKMYRKR